ncbi:MAG: aminomethyl-transferring glycine dehydrogenase subunit GcvPA [Acidobacteriota bacterium]
MKYISVGPDERREMLREVGAASIEQLFASIPSSLRFSGALPVSPSLADPDLEDLVAGLASQNLQCGTAPCFLGAGAYRHYRSPVVDAVLSRAEFYTSYTPYQPEISQGTLQALFEYQTLICQLTEMEVANASLYDGASALAEAVLMAQRMKHASFTGISELVHPHHRQVVATYAGNAGIEFRPLGRRRDGSTDPGAVERSAREGAGAIVIQTPNFLGVIEPLAEIAEAARSAGALLVVSVTEPVSLGLLQGPGRLGADIVVGEGQSFGLPLSFGGPYLGFLACRQTAVRALPGRLVGETKDMEGRRGYVLTLATREQHIRRERATSNICTNQGLCALVVCAQLAALGRRGILRLARLNAWRARQTLERLETLPQVRRALQGAFFNEFVIELPMEAETLCGVLAGEGILAGFPLGRVWPEMKNQLLICATEMTRPSDIEALVTGIGRCCARRTAPARAGARSAHGPR